METRRLLAGAVAAFAALVVAYAAPVGPARADDGALVEYTVVSADGVGPDQAISAITAAGGTVLARNDKVGLFTVRAAQTGFADRVAASSTLAGAGRRAVVGRAAEPAKGAIEDFENAGGGDATVPVAGQRSAGADPLDDKLWGMRMIGADRAHRASTGDRRVTVGILDTGVDASNPDIAANFSWALSRNFAKDIPELDGPCEVPSCLDPVGTDDQGHGTHVAGTVGAAANGVGLSGVAPDGAYPVGLYRRLDALGGDGQPERVAEPDQCREDRLVGGVRRRRRPQPLHERAGELQLVHRQGAQIRQVAVPGAEVVDRDAHAEAGQCAQRAEGGVVGGDDRGFEDLQL